MKWYFASRTKHKNFIKKLSGLLLNKGQEIAFNWTELGLLEPYQNNVKACSDIAEQITKAVTDTDVFILISDQEGTDMFIELGLALGERARGQKIRIYVVGKFNARSLMHFHSGINRVDRLEEVFKIEFPEFLDEPGTEVLSKIDL